MEGLMKTTITSLRSFEPSSFGVEVWVDISRSTSSLCMELKGDVYIVAYLLEARTEDSEKQPLLGNACTQQ
jgi:hypothetical protein